MDILDFMLSERDNIRTPHFLVVEGDIFQTSALNIAFAVNYATRDQKPANNTGGFAGQVAKFIPEVATTEYQKGIPVSFQHCDKTYHALPVHSNEVGGWDEAPELIETCLNMLKVPDEHVVAIVLIGGGKAGFDWNASAQNIAGMLRSNKTLALYLLDQPKVMAKLIELSHLFARDKKEIRRILRKEEGMILQA